MAYAGVHRRRTRAISRWIAPTALIAIGCGGPPTATIPNPLLHGSVNENRLQVADTRLALQYHVPAETFLSTARLSQLTPQTACFQVHLQVDGFSRTSTRFSSWRVWVTTNDGAHLTDAQFADDSTQEHVVEGATDGSALDHAGECVSTMPLCGPTAQTLDSPTIVNVHVVERTADVCFANRNTIRPDTRWVALDLEPPFPDARLSFRWEFGQ